MRATLPWATGQPDYDPHRALLLAVVKQAIVDARKKGDDSAAAMYLTGWGFTPSFWQRQSTRRRKARATDEPIRA